MKTLTDSRKVFGCLQAICFALILTSSIIACSKAKPDNTTQSSQVQPNAEEPATSARPDEPNYCKGCGSSTSPNNLCQGSTCKTLTPTDFCYATAVARFSEDNGVPASSFLNDSYTVRDSLLAVTAGGQWYITYYYALSQVADDNDLINNSTYLTYFGFANELIGIANQLRFGPATATPISSDFQNRASEFINQYHNLTTDTEILGYLDAIENDLDKFVGKDVSFIRTEIG